MVVTSVLVTIKAWKQRDKKDITIGIIFGVLAQVCIILSLFLFKILLERTSPLMAGCASGAVVLSLFHYKGFSEVLKEPKKASSTLLAVCIGPFLSSYLWLLI